MSILLLSFVQRDDDTVDFFWQVDNAFEIASILEEYGLPSFDHRFRTGPNRLRRNCNDSADQLDIGLEYGDYRGRGGDSNQGPDRGEQSP